MFTRFQEIVISFHLTETFPFAFLLIAKLETFFVAAKADKGFLPALHESHRSLYSGVVLLGSGVDLAVNSSCD